MRKTQLIMGMPVTVEVVASQDAPQAIEEVFAYLTEVDNRYSTYKDASEISQINRGLPIEQWSNEMKTVLALCEQTKVATKGYFDIVHNGQRDPSGLVKGWALLQASEHLRMREIDNFYLEAGGDIQVSGLNSNGEAWRIGIRNPFNRHEVIKAITLTTQGIATSGTYIRGQHIYNPHKPTIPLEEVASLTVIGPNIYEADRFATAAFAMGGAGIHFIESLSGFEGYMIDHNQTATLTSNFERYVI